MAAGNAKKYDKKEFIETLEKFINGEIDIYESAKILGVTKETIVKRFNEFLTWQDMERYWK